MATNSSTTIILGLIAAFPLFFGPIVVTLLQRGPRSKPAVPVVPKQDYAGLLEVLAERDEQARHRDHTADQHRAELDDLRGDMRTIRAELEATRLARDHWRTEALDARSELERRHTDREVEHERRRPPVD